MSAYFASSRINAVLEVMSYYCINNFTHNCTVIMSKVHLHLLTYCWNCEWSDLWSMMSESVPRIARSGHSVDLAVFIINSRRTPLTLRRGGKVLYVTLFRTFPIVCLISSAELLAGSLSVSTSVPMSFSPCCCL